MGVVNGYTDVVYAVPNDASRDLINSDDVKGRIAMVHRGEVGGWMGRLLPFGDAWAIPIIYHGCVCVWLVLLLRCLWWKRSNVFRK